jgi:deoxyhypusine synthase
MFKCLFWVYNFFGMVPSDSSIPVGAAAAILQPSDPLPDHAISVQGPDFEKPLSLEGLLKSYERIGFQANSLGRAIHIVNEMVRFRS